MINVLSKKGLLSLALAGSLAFGTMMGSLAYYQSTITSGGNDITAATFNITSDLKTGLEEKSFTIEKAAPGRNGFFEFYVDKTGADFPVEYTVKVSRENPDGDTDEDLTDYLFRDGTPIALSLQRSSNGAYVDLVNFTRADQEISFTLNPAEFDKEAFKLLWNWAYETEGVTDIDFAGDVGNLRVEVVAKQLQDNQNPPEEEEQDVNLAITANTETSYSRSGMFGIRTYEDDDRGVNIQLFKSAASGLRTVTINRSIFDDDLRMPSTYVLNETSAGNFTSSNGDTYQLSSTSSSIRFNRTNAPGGRSDYIRITNLSSSADEWLGITPQ